MRIFWLIFKQCKTSTKSSTSTKKRKNKGSPVKLAILKIFIEKES